jgi:predicted PurR-regulated permease PerM
MAFGTLGVIGEVLLVVVLALFIAHNPGAYERGLLRLFPPDKEEDVASLLRSVAHVLRQWVKGVLLSMTFVGVLTGVGLRIVGVESWLALALLSMFGEFVPFLGPIATGVLGTAVALSQSPETAVRAAVVYLVVQQVETNLVVPLVMKQAVRIQPALLLVWQLVFVNAFGLLGLFIATPLLAALQTAIRIAYVQRALGRPAD